MAKRRTSSFRGKVARDAEKQKKEASFSYLVMPKDVEILVADPGRFKMDILPYVVQNEKHPDRDDEYGIALHGELWYKRPFKIHRDIGPDGDVVICLDSIGEKCPICEYRAKLKAGDGDEEDIKALRAKGRNLYVVIPFDKKWDEEPHIFDISQFLFQDLLNDELEDDEENEIFPDPEEGKTLHIRFDKDKWGGQTFAKTSRIDFKERDYTYEMEYIKDLPNPDEIIEKSILSYKELEKKFLSFTDEDSEDFEEVPDETEEKPSPRKRKTSRKPKQDDDDNGNGEDDTTDEKPTARRTTRSRKPASRRTTKDRCPHGHKFGVDIDGYEDCENCAIWDDCNDEAKNNE